MIAATNRPDVLDPALLRPGRFDRQVVVPLPDIRGRAEILKVHMRKVPLAPDVVPEIIARGTPGFSGADLANIVNEAALFAARGNKRLVDMDDFERAKDKIMMGAERRSMVMTEEERTTTAYHESGHAVVGRTVPKADPVHKVTIIPRGMALGVTMMLPHQDKVDLSKEQAEARITVSMGGRVADETFLKMRTAGASNDIEQATDLARRMVCEWGMSDLGPVSFGKREEQIFLGREIAQHRDYSEATAIRIDEEVKKLVQNGYDRARHIIDEHSDALIRIAEALLEREVLDGGEVQQLIAGEQLPPVTTPRSVPPEDDSTKILKPDSGRRMPGILPEGGPQPA